MMSSVRLRPATPPAGVHAQATHTRTLSPARLALALVRFHRCDHLDDRLWRRGAEDSSRQAHYDPATCGCASFDTQAGGALASSAVSTICLRTTVLQVGDEVAPWLEVHLQGSLSLPCPPPPSKHPTHVLDVTRWSRPSAAKRHVVVAGDTTSGSLKEFFKEVFHTGPWPLDVAIALEHVHRAPPHTLPSPQWLDTQTTVASRIWKQ